MASWVLPRAASAAAERRGFLAHGGIERSCRPRRLEGGVVAPEEEADARELERGARSFFAGRGAGELLLGARIVAACLGLGRKAERFLGGEARARRYAARRGRLGLDGLRPAARHRKRERDENTEPHPPHDAGDRS
jgi:hypothetical protein